MLTVSCIPIIIEICMCAAILGLVIHSKHLLMSLLYIECIMLAVVALIPMAALAGTSQATFITVILLAVSACEASLGLALIVMLSRCHGSDMLKSSSSNKC